MISVKIATLSSSFTRPIAIPATGALIGTPASNNDKQPEHTEAIDEEPFDSVISETTRMVYGNLSKGGNTVAFGEYGLQATSGNWVSDRQIEACRIVLSRYTKREGKIYIRIFPHLAKTKKPAEVRMGSGKGSPEYWVAVVKKNRVMFEIGGVPKDIAVEALRQASYKLPLRTRIVSKEETK